MFKMEQQTLQVNTSAVGLYIVDFWAVAEVGSGIICSVTSLYAQKFSKYSP